MNAKQNVMLEVLKQLHNHHNSKFDAHYETGVGVLIVPYEYPLKPQFVVAKISEQEILMMSYMGVNLSFK